MANIKGCRDRPADRSRVSNAFVSISGALTQLHNICRTTPIFSKAASGEDGLAIVYRPINRY
jgi:hypothetical protein